MNYESLQIRKEKSCMTCSFLYLINRTEVAFLSSTAGRKSLNIVVTHPSTPPPPIFCRHSLKLLSPTLLKLMNWILLSPPPLSSDPDNPSKFGTCTCQDKWEPGFSVDQKQRFHPYPNRSNA